MEDTRLPKCVMFGELVRGAVCVGGQEKEWMECFLDDLRAFGITTDHFQHAHFIPIVGVGKRGILIGPW